MADITVTTAQVAMIDPVYAEVYDFERAESLALGQAVFVDSAGKVAQADANASGEEKFAGIVVSRQGRGLSVLKRGRVYGFTLTGAYGSSVYLSDTAGALSTTPGTNKVYAGVVVPISDADKTKVLYVDAPWSGASTIEYPGFVPLSLTALRKVVANDVGEPVYRNRLLTQHIPLTGLRKVAANDLGEPVYRNRLITQHIPLAGLREIFSNDIGIAAVAAAQGSGGILATDTTPTLEYVNGDTDSEFRVLWAASNGDPVAFQVTLPDDLDTAKDITLMVRGEMGGATDTPTLAVESFFNEGDTKLSDTSAAFTNAVGEFATTIAAADVPAGARTVSVEITPGAHTTDTLIVYGIWLEYFTASVDPALAYTNGDTDSALRLRWAASEVTPVAFQVTLPDDLDTAKDITLMVRGEMGGATDTPVLDTDSYFNEGDTKLSDTSAAFTNAIGEFATTIAAADVPAGARTVSIEITPGAHTTDALDIYAIWLEYFTASVDPALAYTNGDTDSALRLRWAASEVTPVVFQVSLPPDLDEGQNLTIHLRAAMGGATDSPALDADSYFNEGDTKIEDTVTVTGATVAEYTITIAAADVPAGAQTLTVELTPAAHSTDALDVYAVWIEYTKLG